MCVVSGALNANATGLVCVRHTPYFDARYVTLLCLLPQAPRLWVFPLIQLSMFGHATIASFFFHVAELREALYLKEKTAFRGSVRCMLHAQLPESRICNTDKITHTVNTSIYVSPRLSNGLSHHRGIGFPVTIYSEIRSMRT